jgi:hypothetical protein
VKARLDHLVVAAESLATAAVLVERFLGVPLSLGGKHERMGTHNRLLRLGGDAYLELLAVDPAGTRPTRPRWYGLDEEACRAALRQGPRLVHWVVRVDGPGSVPALGFELGRWEPFQRGNLSWHLTVRADGTLGADGVVPSLIAWEGDAHPSQALPDVGCTLQSLELSHPSAEQVQTALNLLGLPQRCAPGAPLLTAEIRTPAGLRRLRSSESVH